jgi:hypothetical protein
LTSFKLAIFQQPAISLNCVHIKNSINYFSTKKH